MSHLYVIYIKLRIVKQRKNILFLPFKVLVIRKTSIEIICSNYCWNKCYLFYIYSSIHKRNSIGKYHRKD